MQGNNTFWDTTTPFASNFKIDGNKLRLLNDFNYPYQITSKDPLPAKGQVSIRIQVNHYEEKEKAINFGIMTTSRKAMKFSGNLG